MVYSTTCIMQVDCVSMDLYPDNPIEAFLAVTECRVTLHVLSLIVLGYTESDTYIHCVIAIIIIISIVDECS